MRSVVPSESATVPLPDHDSLKPVKGPDWAWLTDTDNMSAALTPAALIACPNNLEPNNFISNFPIQMTFLCKPGFPRKLANLLVKLAAASLYNDEVHGVSFVSVTQQFLRVNY